MTKVLENEKVKNYTKPENLVSMAVCNLSGLLPPEEGCEAHNEFFNKNFLPQRGGPRQSDLMIDKNTGKIIKEGEDNPNGEWQNHLSIQDVTGEWICLDCPKNDEEVAD